MTWPRLLNRLIFLLHACGICLDNRLTVNHAGGFEVEPVREMEDQVPVQRGGIRACPVADATLCLSSGSVAGHRSLVIRTRERKCTGTQVGPAHWLRRDHLSPQPHYDFGLRALKAVLASAGILKRERLQEARSSGDSPDLAVLSDVISEQVILIQSVTETIVPELVADDVPLHTSLLADVFPGTEYIPVDLSALRDHIHKVCEERRLVEGERWVKKILQLYQIQKIQHGVMMRLDGIEGVAYVIDPKAMHKDALYGTLDPTTREWNDGLFTHVLRKIVDDVRGESGKRHWIIFDGDVNPEWVENLNSEDVVEPPMIYRQYLDTLAAVPLDAEEDEASGLIGRRVDEGADGSSINLTSQKQIATILEPSDGELVGAALEYASGTVRNVLEYNSQHSGFPLSAEQVEQYVTKRLLVSII
ncbi:hypothetical protein BJV77DRAFT_968376 [Russula vinacea]|nr:hypothetical protein BJV77DRAFT_968376 [Russula vinacea]